MILKKDRRIINHLYDIVQRKIIERNCLYLLLYVLPFRNILPHFNQLLIQSFEICKVFIAFL